MYAVEASGDSKPVPVVTGERWVHTWDWAGGTLAVAVSTPTTLPEVVVRRLPMPGAESRGPRRAAWRGRRTGNTGDGLDRTVRRPDTPVRAPSLYGPVSRRHRSPLLGHGPGGAEEGRRYPTLLNVHGGRSPRMGAAFWTSSRSRRAAGLASCTATLVEFRLRRGLGRGRAMARVRARPGVRRLGSTSRTL